MNNPPFIQSGFTSPSPFMVPVPQHHEPYWMPRPHPFHADHSFNVAHAAPEAHAAHAAHASQWWYNAQSMPLNPGLIHGHHEMFHHATASHYQTAAPQIHEHSANSGFSGAPPVIFYYQVCQKHIGLSHAVHFQHQPAEPVQSREEELLDESHHLNDKANTLQFKQEKDSPLPPQDQDLLQSQIYFNETYLSTKSSFSEIAHFSTPSSGQFQEVTVLLDDGAQRTPPEDELHTLQFKPEGPSDAVHLPSLASEGLTNIPQFRSVAEALNFLLSDLDEIALSPVDIKQPDDSLDLNFPSSSSDGEMKDCIELYLQLLESSNNTI